MSEWEREPPRLSNEDEGAAGSAFKYASPVDRFAQLPKHTRAFLEKLSEEDIATLNDLLLSYERAKTIGWFFKWLLFTMVGAFMGAVAFGEALSKALSWFADAGWKG